MIKLNKTLVTVIAIVGICIFAQIGFAMLVAVGSASETAISVEPSYLKVSPDEEFTVNITVDPDDVEIGCAQYALHFNNNVLKALVQIQGQFLSQDGVSTMVVRDNINNSIGKVEYGEIRLGDPDVIGGVTTPGILATVTFRALEPGMYNLSLDFVQIANSSTHPIPGVLIHPGTVEVEGFYSFDTGSSENPYQSISGTHNGTIIPNQPIVVNKMFTYSCPGTGGHTEFVKIWGGNGVEAQAVWTGYEGDWHNLTFNTNFTLEPGVEYNYTIRTGSYPQIHHADTDKLEVANGAITGTEFIDANGKIHRGCIPAVRLFFE